jgi:hypothetical protein
LSTEPPGPETDDAQTSVPEQLGFWATVQSLGMAIYALLLLTIMCSGSTCAMLSVVALTLPKDPTASGLMAGSEAGAWRLQQLRDLGVVGADETPLVYVDTSSISDGSSGCAFHDGMLTSWQLNRVTGSVAVSGALVTELGRTVAVSQGTDSITCVLSAGDTASRFATMMTVESER